MSLLSPDGECALCFVLSALHTNTFISAQKCPSRFTQNATGALKPIIISLSAFGKSHSSLAWLLSNNLRLDFKQSSKVKRVRSETDVDRQHMCARDFGSFLWPSGNCLRHLLRMLAVSWRGFFLPVSSHNGWRRNPWCDLSNVLQWHQCVSQFHCNQYTPRKHLT